MIHVHTLRSERAFSWKRHALREFERFTVLASPFKRRFQNVAASKSRAEVSALTFSPARQRFQPPRIIEHFLTEVQSTCTSLILKNSLFSLLFALLLLIAECYKRVVLKWCLLVYKYSLTLPFMCIPWQSIKLTTLYIFETWALVQESELCTPSFDFNFAEAEPKKKFSPT